MTRVSYDAGGIAEVKTEYHEYLAPVSGIVGRAGGLGGFLLPTMFATLVNLIGVATTV